MCVRESCRKPFTLTMQDEQHIVTGMCPTCRKRAANKQGWLLDPAIYAECQRIKAEEVKMFGKGSGQRREKAMNAWERKALHKLWRKPLPMNPLTGEAALGGVAKGRTGKVGGPSGRDNG